MPGDELATAATLSPRSIACSALTACGLTLTAAPISPNAGAASNTSACIPKVRSACAAASPASPPPTIAIPQLDGIRPPGGLKRPLGQVGRPFRLDAVVERLARARDHREGLLAAERDA